MSEKYITDNGFGASKDDAVRGYSQQNTTADEDGSPDESWLEEYQEQQAYRNIGFGRNTGNVR